MQLGIIGLGRMGANIARRLMRAGHECVVHDVSADAIDALAREGAKPAKSLDALVAQLTPPRAVWLMIPYEFVDDGIAKLEPLLAANDVVIDGGNSHYADDTRRAKRLSQRGIHFVDAGTSGGVWGLENGYCLMVGGDATEVKRLTPIFEALAPSRDGFLHCGPVGSGHFVKMVHNGIEYGLMAAYAEGFNLLEHAPGYQLDIAKIAELWRHGSVVRSWLLDLAANALAKDAKLGGFQGHVADSGEGRWTVNAAVDAAVPVPVISAALFARFSSRGEDDFANRLLSAMRNEFGGHVEPSG
jgi:6-phosphogluconate dehydrogenase